MPQVLAGVDLAWVSRNNPTAVAVGTLQEQTLSLDRVFEGLYGPDNILACLAAIDSLHGITIDGPTIIRNASGRRPCEGELSSEYGGRKAGCHASNLLRYPEADSVTIGNQLEAEGFTHLGNAEQPWQLECYPHPALIEMFQLHERHLYKKGRVDQKRQGQIQLASMLLSLEAASFLRLRVPDEARVYFDGEAISALKGKALKHNEDVLDAIICLYIAGLYQLDQRGRVFGDAQSGYIYVPQVSCIG